MLRIYDEAHRGGAEVDGAFLFADIRGSTALAERLSSSSTTTCWVILRDRDGAVFKYDGFVDKFVGDELVALFYPLLTGEQFVERAVDAAKEVLRATGHGDTGGPWVPVGMCDWRGSAASARGHMLR